MSERHINKIDGSESKLDLTTFLRIRNISVARYLSENNIDSLMLLEAFILDLESYSHFSVSSVFKNEAKQLFLNNNEIIVQDVESFDIPTNNEKEVENQDTTSVVVVVNKSKKKKSTNNNDDTPKD